MSEAAGLRRWWIPMRPRDPEEPARSATPLELFFDLCFVVAIAFAASSLHHGLAHGHVWESVRSYALVFFAIWWAWVNFTWFASAYDTDDAPYRVLGFLNMTGVLVLAAGVPRVFEHSEFRILTIGYVIMRVALVTQWLRAAKGDPARRLTALRYAVGIAVCQIGWVSWAFAATETWGLAGWFVLAAAELLVPAWAEGASPTPWHRHHIAERYGLLTLIVLGETVLAATIAIQSAIEAHALSFELIRAIVGGLLILFSMWWLYFAEPAAELLDTSRAAFRWGYAHYFVFASVAAVGAGLAVYVDFVTGEAHISRVAASAPLGVSIAIFVLFMAYLHLWPARHDVPMIVAYVVTALGVIAACWTPWPVLIAGIVLLALMSLTVRRDSIFQGQ